jgi:hypothetical protein
MREIANISVISHVIELAIAPVFLLSAIWMLLSVSTNRLGRIIYRSRYLEEKLENALPEKVAELQSGLATLSSRAKIMDFSIALFTFSALLVCAVITILFLGDFFDFKITIPVAIFFIIATFLLVMGLICFLSEIYIATRTLIGKR